MSQSKPFDKEFIKDLAELLSKCDLTEIELEHGESRLRVCREIKQTVYTSAPYGAVPAGHYGQAPQQNFAPQSVADASVNPVPAVVTGEKVTSPMVGTVYTASEPSVPAFVKVGDSVNKGDTILIVEAMKVMNNIPAPKSGIIKQILVSDKEAVEFAQVLMIIE